MLFDALPSHEWPPPDIKNLSSLRIPVLGGSVSFFTLSALGGSLLLESSLCGGTVFGALGADVFIIPSAGRFDADSISEALSCGNFFCNLCIFCISLSFEPAALPDFFSISSV